MLKLIILFAFNLFEENNEDRERRIGIERAGLCVCMCVLGKQDRGGTGQQNRAKRDRKPGDTQRSLWFKSLLGILSATHSARKKQRWECERISSPDAYTPLATASELSVLFIYMKRAWRLMCIVPPPKNLNISHRFSSCASSCHFSPLYL